MEVTPEQTTAFRPVAEKEYARWTAAPADFEEKYRAIGEEAQ